MIKKIILIIITLLVLILQFREKLYFFPTSTDYPIKSFIEKNNVKIFTINNMITWYIPPIKNTKKILFYCHGNAGNITMRIDILKELMDNIGCGIIIIDYLRIPNVNIKNIISHSQNIIDIIQTKQIQKHIDINPINKNDIILYGESIGCAISLELAKNNNIKNIIFMSGFTSMFDMINHILGNFSIILKPFITELDNYKIIKTHNLNILVLHSKNDDVIPYSQAKKLNELQNVEFNEIKGTHNYRIIPPKTFNRIIEKFSIL